LSNDAADTADLYVPLSNTADLLDLQACETFEAPTNSDVFHVP